MHSKVSMSLLVAVLSVSSVSAQDNVKVKVDSANVTAPVKKVVVTSKKKKTTKKTRNDNQGILNGNSGNTTTGASTPTEFQDGDDLWLRIRDGHRFMSKPVESGIYLHKGKKIAIK